MRTPVMRSCQVYAVKHIVKFIDYDNCNGDIWHNTSIGKALTSFNAVTLATLSDTLLPKLLNGEISAVSIKT